MLNGTVVPLLGAGVNMSGRPPGTTYDRPHPDYLPSGAELARFLADEFEYPELVDLDDLIRVSQYVEVMEGSGELYQALHRVFDRDYRPGLVHTFLAELPPALCERGSGRQLILTTNYDDVLERAFEAAGEEYDLITYVCPNPVEPAAFTHLAPGASEPVRIVAPNEYAAVDPDRRTVILKMHGAVVRGGSHEMDNYVISEDNYIDYLAQTDVTSLLPATILRRLRYSHFLFLGYGMRDWNLRVILRRIWGTQKLEYPSWSIQRRPDALEAKFWADRNVTIYDYDVDDYIRRLRSALDARLVTEVRS